MLPCIGAHESIDRSLFLQVLDECEQRSFACVEREKIEILEYARLVQGAQFGVAITAAQHRDDARVNSLDGLRDTKRTVDVAGKGRGKEHEIRSVQGQRLERQFMQEFIDKVVGCIERRLQKIEGRLARGQGFCVAHELKARVDAIANDVRKVIEIQRGYVLRAILNSQGAKGPVERVAFG
jgi:hypothetical protein